MGVGQDVLHRELTGLCWHGRDLTPVMDKTEEPRRGDRTEPQERRSLAGPVDLDGSETSWFSSH